MARRCDDFVDRFAGPSFEAGTPPEKQDWGAVYGGCKGLKAPVSGGRTAARRSAGDQPL
jgi:hypothetical protein